MEPTPSTAAPLEVRLFGSLEVVRDGQVASLPQSKKTRALLAYLAVTGRAHRRERLCDLLWDVADDPRGALRWSLSKLRRVVDDDARRIVANRETVAFESAGARIDSAELASGVARGVSSLSTDELEQLAIMARGEFLEGLDLPDFHEFAAWCVAERERARERQATVFGELVERLAGEPRRALPHVRRWVQSDAFSVPAKAALLRVLVGAGKLAEAQQQFDLSVRLLDELGAPGRDELTDAWRQISDTASSSARERAVAAAPTPAPAPAPEPEPAPASADALPMVGRDRERARMVELLDETRRRKNLRVALITGEPGGGKTRLAQFAVAQAAAAGSVVLDGRAYEVESSRPYGPWADAVRSLPVSLDGLLDASGDGSAATRDALFGAVTEAIGTQASQAGGGILILDDIQWMDRDSASMLHFVARMNRQRPLLIVLLARTGELADNQPVLRVLRSVRRDVPVEELPLAPLSAAEVATLVAEACDAADSSEIFDACAGNPLYALELARAAAADDGAAAPRSLIQLVRDRVDRLPPNASDVLRWAAVLGYTVDVGRLEALSSLELDELLDAFEILERHDLLRAHGDASGGARYQFAHDVVREAVYGELSHPRRKLMHQRVARSMADRVDEPAIATQVAHHASLAGDAALGVRACVTAARRSLRVFAHGDAEDLARRGLHMAEGLPERDRISASVELLQVRYAARVPDPEEASAALEPLVERALDLGLTRHARLGFHVLSYMRWDTGAIAAAHDDMMQAERISRSADPSVRADALAEAAKCLVMLEKNLDQAEAFALEADALGSRHDARVVSLPFTRGMLEVHRGQYTEAFASFRESRISARDRGDRILEFYALERWVMMLIDVGRYADAAALGEELAALGAKVREGSENISGRGLHALARWLDGDESADAPLQAAIEELRIADSKLRLTYLITRVALRHLDAGRHDAVAELAAQALAASTALDRASEMALARWLLWTCARAAGDDDAAATHADALADLARRDIAANVVQRLDEVLAAGVRPQG